MCGNVMLLSKHDAGLLVRNKTVYRLDPAEVHLLCLVECPN